MGTSDVLHRRVRLLQAVEGERPTADSTELSSLFLALENILQALEADEPLSRSRIPRVFRNGPTGSTENHRTEQYRYSGSDSSVFPEC